MSCCWVADLCPIGFMERCIYAIDNKNNNMCVRRCLAIFERVKYNLPRPAKDTMRDALNLAQKFYRNPSLRVRHVRPTKLVNFKNIASRFRVNIRLYKSISNSVWKLASGHVNHRRSFPNVDIGLYEGHCF